MDTQYLLMLGIGLTVATVVGGLVYRDATTRGLSHSAIWALTTGGLSGMGVVLAARLAIPTQRTLYDTIHSNEAIVATTPFEVLIVGLVLALLFTLFIVSIYRIGTHSNPASQAQTG